jgi:hypothetical protein
MSLKLTDLQVTSFYSPITTSCYAGLADSDGHVILAWFDSTKYPTPPSTAGIFAIDCLMINIGGTTDYDILYFNTGTVASPTWTFKMTGLISFSVSPSVSPSASRSPSVSPSVSPSISPSVSPSVSPS